MYLDDDVIGDIQARLADGRPPAGETADGYYDRYEVDEAWLAGTAYRAARFKITDLKTGLAYYLALEAADDGEGTTPAANTARGEIHPRPRR